MTVADGGDMTVVGGVAVAVMSVGAMSMVMVLVEPQVVERRMVAAEDMRVSGAGMAAEEAGGERSK